MIIKKVKLVAPPFVGTKITINVTADQLSFGIISAVLADGHEKMIVDWGDGHTTEGEQISMVEHTYAAPGTYVVSISDDMQSLQISRVNELSPFTDIYPRCIQRIESDATCLTVIRSGSLKDAVNLRECDFSKSSLTTISARGFAGCSSMQRIALPDCLQQVTSWAFIGCASLKGIKLPPGVDKLNASVFDGCVSFTGRMEFPYIKTIVNNPSNQPFAGCTGGITEFAFAKANEATIKQSAAYQTDPTLGTGTAVCTFAL